MFTWEWAITNVRNDMEEETKSQTDTIVAVLDALKPWLNYDLWKANEQTQKSVPATRTLYEEELRKRGATEEEIKGVLDKEEGSDDSEFDPPPIIVR